MFETILPGVQHLQNIHPLVVHFPIAFLVGAALFYFLSSIFRNQTFATTAFLLLILGTLAAGAAVGTGLYGEEGVMVSRSVREHLLEYHEKIMLGTLGLSIVLSIWALVARPFPKTRRWIFLVLLLVLLGVMTVGADYGARMVYDYNAGGSACSQPIEFTK
ncbi:MAG TPA: DUF2231 domain-containing protein [Thermodesulfobacteriota bacterium]|nr:DUF2231 domain-containing protein [Thermodesulfobacteriota bacterium]